MNIFIEIATDIVYSLTIVTYFNYLLPFRAQQKFITLLVLFNSLADFLLIKYLQFDNANYFVNILLILCTVLFFKNLKKGISYAVVLEIIFLISDGIAFYTLLLIVELPSITLSSDPMYMAFGIVLTNITNILLAFLCARHFKFLQGKEVPNYYWISFCLVPSVSAILLFHIFDVYLQTGVELVRTLASIISIMILNLINLILYTKIIEYYNFKLNSEVTKARLEIFLQKQDLLSTVEKDIFRVQHDLKNSLLPVRSALKSQDYETAINEIDKIVQAMTIRYKISNTGIDYIDDMINYKYRSTRDSEIAFELTFNSSGEWEFNYLDISKVIGIALDNSIEACEKIEGKRLISIDLTIEKGILVIVITNPKSHNLIYGKSGEIVSTKSEDKHHGLGLNSIKKIVKNNNGHFQIEYSNNSFKITIVFYAQNK